MINFGPLALLPILGIFETIADLDFVIKIMTFSYMLLWLYSQLRDAQILFGIGVMISGYFLFIQPLPTIIIVILFVVFVSLGMHLQMLIQFGVFPLFRFFGIELEHPEMREQQEMQNIQRKMQHGEELNEQEEKFLEGQQKKDYEYQRQMQNRLIRYGQ